MTPQDYIDAIRAAAIALEEEGIIMPQETKELNAIARMAEESMQDEARDDALADIEGRNNPITA